jgi:Uma2 family endonuclease
MSLERPLDRRRSVGLPEGVRFHPRKRAPAPLFGSPNVNYPSSDGRIRSNDTLQGDWMVKIKGSLDAIFDDDPNVYVTADLLWYPVEGNNRRRLAPDVMVAFGRPKGDRDSYVQHQEDGIPPQVVFEILPLGYAQRVMDYKRHFCERYGVEEYYVLDPHEIGLEAWIKEGDAFRRIADPADWVSPRLGIRFELGDDLTIYRPDGRRFESYQELWRRAEQERLRADDARLRADDARLRADDARLRADDARLRADDARRLRLEFSQRADRLAARLRAVGIDPD